MEGALITSDGCTIAYDYRPMTGRPVLVLSPSLGTAMALFGPQLVALGEHYGLLLYDPRGHGHSAVPAGDYTLARLAEDVIELLDHLDIGSAHFLGVSLGGMVGQHLAVRAPERIDGLILANTSAYMGPPESWAARIDTVRQQGIDAVADAVIERWFTAGFRQSGARAVSETRALLLDTAPAGYAGCCAAIRDMDQCESIAGITALTLVIDGLQDPATPPDHARFLANAITNAKLVELDAAHLSNVEVAGAFNAAVLEFLGELK